MGSLPSCNRKLNATFQYERQDPAGRYTAGPVGAASSRPVCSRPRGSGIQQTGSQAGPVGAASSRDKKDSRQMIPKRGSSHRRKGRASIPGQYYLLTTSTHERRKFFGTLSGLMHRLKGYSSKKIKSLLKYQGRIWQEQYHDHAIRKDEVLADVITYCLNNPVRAGLVRDFHEYPYWYCQYEV